MTAPDESGTTEAAGSAESAVLRLTGDVDALTQQEFRASADRLLDGDSVRRLVVDMAEVQTIDSSGLGLLVHLHALTRERDIAMSIANVPARAQALLVRTGLDRVFAIDGATQG